MTVHVYRFGRERRVLTAVLILSMFLSQFVPASPVLAASPALTVTPLTWNVIGLDSNNVYVGPNDFPVGVRVCNSGTADATSVSAKFVWDTTNPFIFLRPDSLGAIALGTLTPGSCANAYFEVLVDRKAGAYDQSARYHIEVTSTEITSPVKSATPRELYVEHLVSQSRNAINDLQWRLAGAPAYQSVAAGKTMTLLIGNTYDIKLVASTATQGYNQLEDFITLSNTYFRINSVQSTYSATALYDNTVPGATYDSLYADSCGWDNNPDSPTKRSCIISDDKSGGSITTNFNVTILSAGVGKTVSLNSMVYDFSGSSFHYNADYGASARFASIVSPISITKSFTPSTVTPGSTAKLDITLSNASTTNTTNITFADNLPVSTNLAQLSVDPSTPPTYSSGCLGGSLLSVSGASNANLSFSGGVTAAAGSTPGVCTVSVVVKVPPTPTADTYLNVTGNVFVNSMDTGANASASLTVSQTSPGTGLACTPSPLVTWAFPTGFSLTNPAASANSYNAQAAIGAGLVAKAGTDRASATGSGSWGSNGAFDNTGGLSAPNLSLNDYFEFSLDTSSISQVTLGFYAYRTNNGPTNWAVYYGKDAANLYAGPQGTVPGGWAIPTLTSGSLTFKNTDPGWNKNGPTLFRIYGYNANQSNTGADMYLDDVSFSGCTTFQPSISKAFSPNPVLEGAESTLTFTLSNNNSTEITEATFSDVLPAGLTISSAPVAGDNTCGGALSAPVGGSTISVSGTNKGAVIPANGSCTIKVKVKGSTQGTYNNISGRLTTKELGTNTTSSGVAQSALTVVAAPGFTKSFAPNPIYAGQTATLTFTLTNPNRLDITGTTFTDPLPSGLTVAGTPSAVSTCPSATFAPAAGASSVTFTGTLPANSSCTVKVNVTASAVNNYVNPQSAYALTASSVTGLIVTGPTDTLAVIAHHPAINILKQVSLSPAGPWSSNLNMAAGTPVYYRIRVENVGDVDLSSLNVSDNQYSLTACHWPATLPAASATQDPTVTCVVGPVDTSSVTSGSFENTATVSATYNGDPVPAASSKATYTVSDLLITKDASPASFSAAGDVLTYTYVVKNNSATAVLAGPVVITDNLAAVTCPSLNTIGNGDNNLDPGESITCTASYTVTTTNLSAGSVTNSAYAVVGGVTSNVVRKSVYVVKPDLTLTKTDDSGGFGKKDTPFNWVMTVNNLGPVSATFLSGETILSDPLPAGPDYILSSPTPTAQTDIDGNINCQISLGTLNCTASGGPLTIGALTGSFTVTLGVTPKSGSSLANTATIDPNDRVDEANDGNNSGSDTVAVDANVYAISLSKNASPTTYAARGSSITYTYTITNQGTTNLPGPFTVSDDKIASVNCNAVPAGGLAPMAALTCTATYMIQQADLDAGSLTNTATASTALSGSTLLSNQATATISAVQNPALTFTKTAAKQYSAPAAVGNTIQYSLVATNSGNVTLNSVSIVDTKLGSLACTRNGAATTQPAALAPGDNLTCTGAYALTQADIDAGKVNNSATASSKRLDGSDGPAGKQDLSTSIEQNPLIEVVKTSTTSEVTTAGQVVPYTFQVSNPGNLTLTNITIGDPKCDAAPVYASGDANADSQLQVGETWTYACSRTVSLTDFSAGGKLTNTVTVDSAESAPAAAILQINIRPNPKIGVAISSTTTQITAVDQQVPYFFTVTNPGNLALSNIQVSDPVCDAAPVYVSGDDNSDGKLQVDETWRYTCSHKVTQADMNAGGNFNSPVTADSDESTLASAAMNIPVIQAPAITLKKTAVPALSYPVKVGDSISYTLLATNTGNVTLNTVAVADPLLPTLTCTKIGAATIQPATLAPGENLTCTGAYRLVRADIDAGKVMNTAAVTSKLPDGSNGPSASDGLTIATLIRLIKVGMLNAAGDAINYTLTATNPGATPLTNVAITDPKLGALSCTPSTSPVTLAPGESLTCSGRYALKQADLDAGQVTNSATVSSDSASDTQTVVTPLPQSPALSLTKTATAHFSTPAARSGDSLEYTLTALNIGNITLKSVAIADPKLGGLTCSQPVDLAPGSSLVCTGTYTLTQADIDAAKVSNGATVTSSKPDGSTGPSNQASLDTPVPQSAKINVVKDSTTASITTAGQGVLYTFMVTNPGNVTLTNISVSDPNCDTPPPAYSAGDTNNDGKLQPTETWTYTCSHQVTQAEMDAGGSLTGQVTAGSNESAPAYDTLAIPVVQGPRINVVKSATTTSITRSGQGVPYTFTVTNPGTVTLTGISLSDPNCDAPAQYSQGDTNKDNQLQVTEIWIYTCSHVVSQAEVDLGNPIYGSVTADSVESALATDLLGIPVLRQPAIMLSKTATPKFSQPAAVGDAIDYSLVAKNTGNISLSAVTIVDSKLSSLTCQPASPAALLPGQSLTCMGTYQLTQADISAGKVDNSASVSSQLPEGTPGPGDADSISATVPQTQAPALTLTQTVDRPSFSQVGEVLTFTLTAANTGSVPLTAVSITPNALVNWSCQPGQPATLAPGESLVCTGTHTVTPDDLQAAGYNNPGSATGTPPNGAALTATALVDVPGVTVSYHLYLPTIQSLVSSQSWALALGYEDLPLVFQQNDYDYNDWMVEISGNTQYTNNLPQSIQGITFDFTPRAHGGIYNHTFGIRIPAQTFHSDGTAYISIYNERHALISLKTLRFTANQSADFVIFERTSDAFHSAYINSVDGSPSEQPQRYASLRIAFDQPVTLSFDLSHPHGANLFFDPYLKILNTGDEVHRGDLRVLSVPQAGWRWPEEGVRIDKAYPKIGYTAGMPPAFQFPDQWWDTSNQCVYDGVACKAH